MMMLASAASEMSANIESEPQPNSLEEVFNISDSSCESLRQFITYHLLAHDIRPTDLVQLMNFNQHYALCVQKRNHTPHFRVDGSWYKSLHLQSVQ